MALSALETFKELKSFIIGILTMKSDNLSKDLETPACSAPMIIAEFMLQ